MKYTLKHFLCLVAMMGVLTVSAQEHLQKKALASDAKKTFTVMGQLADDLRPRDGDLR